MKGNRGIRMYTETQDRRADVFHGRTEPLWKIDGASHSVWTYVKEQVNESI